MPLSVAVPDWLLPYACQPAEVVAFCAHHGDLLDHLRTALELVRSEFTSPTKLEVRLERDPGIDGESLVVEVTASDDVDRFLEVYNRCILSWARTLPPKALSVLCLTYHLT